MKTDILFFRNGGGRNLILILFLISFSFSLSAQICGQVTDGSNFASIWRELNGPVETKVVRTYWHVIRRSDGTMDRPLSFYHSLIQGTKDRYDSHQIYLRSCYYDTENQTEVIFHDSDELYAVSEFGSICLFDEYCISDGLNVFLIEKATQGRGEANIRGNHCWVTVSSVGESVPVIIHEIGHCFGLFHTSPRPRSIGTRKGNKSHTWQCDDKGDNGIRYSLSGRFTDCEGNTIQVGDGIIEFVNGSNGATAGDFVIDTPSDIADLDLQFCENNPYLNCSVSANSCDDNVLDPKGRRDGNCVKLVPDWFNYMRTGVGNTSNNLSGSICFTHFTPGQVSRMHKVISQYLSSLLTTFNPEHRSSNWNSFWSC